MWKNIGTQQPRGRAPGRVTTTRRAARLVTTTVMASLVLSGCQTDGMTPAAIGIHGAGDSTQDVCAMEHQALAASQSYFTDRIVAGAIVGGVLGGLVGAFTGGKNPTGAILAGVAAGAVAGGGNAYFRAKQQEHAEAAQLTASIYNDALRENTEIDHASVAFLNVRDCRIKAAAQVKAAFHAGALGRPDAENRLAGLRAQYLDDIALAEQLGSRMASRADDLRDATEQLAALDGQILFVMPNGLALNLGDHIAHVRGTYPFACDAVKPAVGPKGQTCYGAIVEPGVIGMEMSFLDSPPEMWRFQRSAPGQPFNIAIYRPSGIQVTCPTSPCGTGQMVRVPRPVGTIGPVPVNRAVALPDGMPVRLGTTIAHLRGTVPYPCPPAPPGAPAQSGCRGLMIEPPATSVTVTFSDLPAETLTVRRTVDGLMSLHRANGEPVYCAPANPREQCPVGFVLADVAHQAVLAQAEVERVAAAEAAAKAAKPVKPKVKPTTRPAPAVAAPAPTVTAAAPVAEHAAAPVAPPVSVAGVAELTGGTELKRSTFTQTVETAKGDVVKFDLDHADEVRLTWPPHRLTDNRSPQAFRRLAG